jgi:hypothetical protein
MRDDGVVLEPHGDAPDDQACLVTTDPEVARKYGMEEDEGWEGGEGQEGAGS